MYGKIKTRAQSDGLRFVSFFLLSFVPLDILVAVCRHACRLFEVV